MKNQTQNNCNNCQSQRGIVLLITLVLLVVLSAVGYTLSSRVATQRHRNKYIIDYQRARYACDSALKYALAVFEDMNTPELAIRADEPDFSDLFSLSEQEYIELLAGQATQSTPDVNQNSNDVNDTNDIDDVDSITSNEPDTPTIPGPYGPHWPFITEPVEFKIGSATVRIEIEDENAKYPLGWALLDDKKLHREAIAGLETFCEWMSVSYAQIDTLKSELDKISKIKTFKLKFKPITKTKRTKRRRRGRKRSRVKKNVVSASVHTADFAKLFHSSLIDTETLAKPTIISETRKESTLKYIGLWGSSKVNINTAPRHVLEAAFTFGGDAEEIAEEIIRRRRIKPFTDTEDLRKSLFRYSDSIRKCEKYITMTSRFFTIRVTAISGVSRASAVVAVTKDGKKIERIAVISG